MAASHKSKIDLHFELHCSCGQSFVARVEKISDSKELFEDVKCMVAQFQKSHKGCRKVNCGTPFSHPIGFI